jgi:hypothetical protein
MALFRETEDMGNPAFGGLVSGPLIFLGAGDPRLMLFSAGIATVLLPAGHFFHHGTTEKALRAPPDVWTYKKFEVWHSTIALFAATDSLLCAARAN